MIQGETYTSQSAASTSSCFHIAAARRTQATAITTMPWAMKTAACIVEFISQRRFTNWPSGESTRPPPSPASLSMPATATGRCTCCPCPFPPPCPCSLVSASSRSKFEVTRFSRDGGGRRFGGRFFTVEAEPGVPPPAAEDDDEASQLGASAPPGVSSGPAVPVPAALRESRRIPPVMGRRRQKSARGGEEAVSLPAPAPVT